jgi:hypothetical protein
MPEKHLPLKMLDFQVSLLVSLKRIDERGKMLRILSNRPSEIIFSGKAIS